MNKMIPVKLHCFGPLQIIVNGRLQPKFATDRARLLLVYLTTAESRAYRRDELAALLWPDRPDKVARQNLRTTLSRMRRATAEYDNNLLITDYKTVRLNHDLIESDVAQFSALLATSEGHRHQPLRACSTCVKKLEQAVALYRGDFLQGFHVNECAPLEEWLLLTRELWRQEALQTLASLTSYYEQQQDYQRTITYARQLLTLESWHEQGQQQLMRALTFNGQRTEALAQYDRYVADLATELAIQPEQETILLYEAIRREELIAPDVEEKTAVFHHFPTEAAVFIGRTAEIAEIKNHLANDNCRLLTVLGVGGIGKTRLITQAALTLPPQQFPDGIYFIPLANLRSPSEILPLIGENMGYVFDGPQSTRQQLFSYLQDTQALLVFDNFEHLLDGADIIADLLAATTTIKCLTTSRMALQIEVEWRMVLTGLSHDNTANSDAVALFVARAQQFRHFQPFDAAEMALVSDICQLVAGMPLAIEMAAAWLRVYDLPAIVAEIVQNLDFLISPLRDVPRRHQSMRAVFEGSWQLLPPHDQRVFARLSLFQGGFSQTAAQTVSDASLLDLAWLLDKSLIQRLANGRYSIHELLRQFASEKLEAMGTKTAVCHQHSNYYLTLAAEQTTILRGHQSLAALKRLHTDIDNIRQAWAWAISQENNDQLSQSRQALSDYFLFNGLYEDAVRFFDPSPISPALQAEWQLTRIRFMRKLGKLTQAEAFATSLTTNTDPAIAAAAHLQLADIAYNRHHIKEMGAQIAHVNVLVQTHNLTAIIPKCEHLTGLFLLETGKPVEAERIFNRNLQQHRQQEDLWEETNVLTSLARTASMCYRDARPFFLSILAIQRQLGSRVIQRQTLHHLGSGSMFRYDYAAARTYFQEVVAICKQVKNESGLATAQLSLAHVAHRLGDFTQARQLYTQAQIAFIRLGDRTNEALCLLYLGLLSVHEGAFTTAITLCQQAKESWVISHSVAYLSLADGCIGQAYAGMESWTMAQQHYEKALTVQKELHLPGRAMDTQALLAETLLAQGQRDEALALVEEVLAYLSATALHKSDEPFRLEWACCRVLAAHGDARAQTLAQEIYAKLVAQTAVFTTTQQQNWFWERISTNAGIKGMVNGRLPSPPSNANTP